MFRVDLGLFRLVVYLLLISLVNLHSVTRDIAFAWLTCLVACSWCSVIGFMLFFLPFRFVIRRIIPSDSTSTKMFVCISPSSNIFYPHRHLHSKADLSYRMHTFLTSTSQTESQLQNLPSFIILVYWRKWHQYNVDRSAISDARCSTLLNLLGIDHKRHHCVWFGFLCHTWFQWGRL